MLAFVEMARLCDVDWAALGNYWWVLYEYDEAMPIFLRGREPLKRILSEEMEQWHDGGEEICQIHCKE